MAIKLVISGCSGRMGRAIAGLALQDSAFAIGAALEQAGHDALGRDLGTLLGRPAALGIRISDDAGAAIGKGDVLIEFTSPEATVAHVQAARQLGKPVVVGTTGLSTAQQAALRDAANAIPVLVSPNMSVGVNLLFELVEVAAERLGLAYQVEIEEAHHQGKKDAPSGTAKRLQELIARVRSRPGTPPETVPCRSIREGDIVGDHTVIFSGRFDRLELKHHAQSRDVFALGALKAAAFIVHQPPGLYDMMDVLRQTADMRHET